MLDRSLILSLLFHVVIFAFLLNDKSSTEQINNQISEFHEVELIDYPNETVHNEKERFLKNDINEQQSAEKMNEIKNFCHGRSESYYGIGIVVSGFGEVIISAPEMFPGYIAGIRIGDKIAKVKNTDKSTISVTILRNDVEQSYTIKKNKICYKGQ